MTSPTLIKSMAAIGTVGGVSGGAYLVSPYLFSNKNRENKITISDHIQSLNLKLISSLEKTQLENQWEEEFKLDEINIKATIGVETTWEKFRDWCDNSLKLKKSEHETIISNVKKWCTVGTIEDRISRKTGMSLISEEGASDDWNKIYNDNSDETLRTAIGLGTKEQSTQQADIEKIQIFCKSEKKKEFLAESKEASFDKVEKWCTKSN